MARMRPELREEELSELRSPAEAIVYRALRDQLPEDVLVIHSLGWIYKTQSNRIVEGEADFTVFSPAAGFLAIEVKGGGISFDAVTGKWSSIDRKGRAHAIKDPFRQASSERFAVLDQIRGHAEWQKWPGGKITAGHAVIFPDVDGKGPLIGPERPAEIIGVRLDLEDLPGWLAKAQQFWNSSKSLTPLGILGMSLIEAIFCRSILVRPLLVQALRHEEERRIELTVQQARVLRVLGGRKRAIIAGGAGTGKTLLAVEKVRSLGAGGQRVLFLCYNQLLAEALSRSLRDLPNATACGFHEFSGRRIADVTRATGRALLTEASDAFPGKDKFDVHMPFALALSTEILPDKFDAIVVDEAQDFSEEYWFAVEALLGDPNTAPLYIFTDANQAVYRRNVKLPVDEEPFVLTTNCRNTAHIHDAAYRYYQGEPTEPPGIEGAEVKRLVGRTVGDQSMMIAREISRLVTNERLRADQIVVLVLGRPKNLYYETLTGQHLGSGVQWTVERHDPSALLVDTVRRFKGLEATVVFLWLAPVLDEDADRESLYVGLSRAKSILYLVGSEAAINALT
jgi:hypothetical protein